MALRMRNVRAHSPLAKAAEFCHGAAMSTAQSPSFRGCELACRRGGRLVFSRLDFTLEAGGALMLLGPNGSGKSSLLRVLAGLLRPCHGRLDWNGQTLADDPEAHAARTHYLGHHDAIKPVLTVVEMVRFWARLHHDDPAHADRAATTAIDRFGLAPLADMPGRMLSAGQKRRVNLARLLAAPCPLWLMDEPTTALDRASIAVLETVLAEHRAEGGMVVLSTHADIALPDAAILNLDRFAAAPEGLS